MTKLLFITMLFLNTGQILAQKIPQNGIYQTATDFLAGKLTNGFFSSKKSKLNDNNYKSIRIEREGKRTIYASSEIWGFRKNGIDYRVFEKEFYKIDEVGPVVICTVQDYLSAEQPLMFYYRFFSKDLNTPIIALTRRKLKHHFADDSTIINKINSFPKNRSVSTWSSECRCFPIIKSLQ